MDQQEQIYVLSGVVAVLAIVIFALLGYVLYRIAVITELMAGPRLEKRDTYAYNNPGILRGEELNRRGFVIDGSSSLNRTGAPSTSAVADSQDPVDFSHILNNDQIVFGGDLPANARQGITNDNFSFNGRGSRDAPASAGGGLTPQMSY